VRSERRSWRSLATPEVSVPDADGPPMFGGAAMTCMHIQPDWVIWHWGEIGGLSAPLPAATSAIETGGSSPFAGGARPAACPLDASSDLSSQSYGESGGLPSVSPGSSSRSRKSIWAPW
jgi:hypothetical protein